MNNINDKQIFLKSSQENIEELNKKFEKRKLKPSEMLARFQWYRQNGLPAKVNSLIEKFALEETGKNRGRIPQLILESDFPKLRKEIDNAIKTREELERLKKLKPRYGNTNYQDFDDYYESEKRLWESQIESEKELLNLNETLWEQIRKVNQKLWKEFQPVWVKEYLARKQFYWQNNLPVELNLIIEEMVVSDYTHPSQQNNYKRLADYDKERNQRLANLARFQDYLKNLEQEKENYSRSFKYWNTWNWRIKKKDKATKRDWKFFQRN